MKRAACVLAFALMFVLGSTAVQAAPPTQINGVASGLELCPQFICGFAAFTGIFQGQIGNNPNAIGIVSTALTHSELPTSPADAAATINTGIWKLQTLSGPIAGAVVGGFIKMTPDPSFKLFHVVILLATSNSKFILFDGTLDHRPLIPTFSGTFKTL